MDGLVDIQSMTAMAQGMKGEADMGALKSKLQGMDVDGIREAAQAFESYFVESMLKQMRRTVPKMQEGQGQSMAIFEGMFDQAISKKISEGRGIGLADMLEKSMRRQLDASMGQSPDVGHAHGPESLPPGLSMGRVSSAFGLRQDPFSGEMKDHRGIDIALPEGAPVHPVRPGTVVFSGVNGGYGQSVVVDHGQGVQSTYAHLSERFVEVGQQVGVDEIVGSVGQTGRATGPHLHLEVRDNGKPMDPEEFLRR